MYTQKNGHHTLFGNKLLPTTKAFTGLLKRRQRQPNHCAQRPHHHLQLYKPAAASEERQHR